MVAFVVEEWIASLIGLGRALSRSGALHLGREPHQGEMATQALFAGDPVVIVYPDGHELLVRPEHVGGIAALLLVVAAFFLRHRRREEADVVRLPLGARIEARDSSGYPIAA